MLEEVRSGLRTLGLMMRFNIPLVYTHVCSLCFSLQNWFANSLMYCTLNECPLLLCNSNDLRVCIVRPACLRW